MKQVFHISVGDLIQRYLFSGDLDFSGGSGEKDAHLTGMKMHKLIQKSRPEGYRKEVEVHYAAEYDDCTLEVSGRMDLLYREDGLDVVEEIKSTGPGCDELPIKQLNLTGLPDVPNAAHVAQLYCYTYMYMHQMNIDTVLCRLTYISRQTKQVVSLDREYALEDEGRFFRKLLDRFRYWSLKRAAYIEKRDKTAGDLQFPYGAYREGQREAAVQVFRAARDKTRVLLEAATGLGKTMAALFPGCKALGKGLTEKIFYATSRSTGKQMAETALRDIRRSGMNIISVTLTAKEKICINDVYSCTPADCPYARGFFERLPDGLEAAFTEYDFCRETITKLAGKFRLCPFEYSLALSIFADVVICDYNYIFDPRVYLRRFFGELLEPPEKGKDYLFLIDEAHNLPDRARSMYSASIRLNLIRQARKEIGKVFPEVRKAINKLFTYCNKLKKELEKEWETGEAASDELIGYAYGVMGKIETLLSSGEKLKAYPRLEELYFELSFFIRITDFFNESYLYYWGKTRGGSPQEDFIIKQFCLNPAGMIENILKERGGAVFFSATLRPFSYFKSIFGLEPSCRALSIGSCYSHENLGVLTISNVSTLYKNRDKTSADIARILSGFIRQGARYLFFFPSYGYMNMIVDLFSPPDRLKTEVVIQEPSMDEESREKFLEKFTDSENGETVAGFAVLGGVFGEGIDLVGDYLNGAAIIGVGMPGLSFESDSIKEYYNKKGEDGFAFAYRYPGMIKVLQAAGRVIRSEKDRGVVLLIDERYGSGSYFSLFPDHWKPAAVHDMKSLQERIEAFYSD